MLLRFPEVTLTKLPSFKSYLFDAFLYDNADYYGERAKATILKIYMGKYICTPKHGCGCFHGRWMRGDSDKMPGERSYFTLFPPFL
jgi:hypothetical protein